MNIHQGFTTKSKTTKSKKNKKINKSWMEASYSKESKLM